MLDITILNNNTIIKMIFAFVSYLEQYKSAYLLGPEALTCQVGDLSDEYLYIVFGLPCSGNMKVCAFIYVRKKM